MQADTVAVNALSTRVEKFRSLVIVALLPGC